jgi:glutamate 5-kinase
LKDLTRAKRIVVKVGSNVLTARNGLNTVVIDALTHQICHLIDDGRQVLLVSSGAMAAGMKTLRLDRRPESIPNRQAIAAVGQSGLMHTYEQKFARYGKHVAQILLTSEDLNIRKRYLNARNALNTLLSWRVVPIINENDTIMVEEIKLGDNDNLSAMIALLMDADALINLTDIGGLFTKDPRSEPDAVLIPEVTTIGKRIESYAGGIAGALGTGGMQSKIRAAKKLTAAGVPMVIAQGDKTDILLRLTRGERHGTYFVPNTRKLNRRKCWIAYTLKPRGALNLDEGAAQAIVKKGKSLLPSGIVAVEGNFSHGAAVVFKDRSGRELGVGLINYSAAETRAIMGLQTSQIAGRLGAKPYDEVVHRNNLVITAGINGG